jgi:hypothetical protein
MKNKWWAILLILFLGVILLSVLINRQSQIIVSLSPQETMESETKTETLIPAYSAPLAQAMTTPLPSARRGITIIQPASTKLEGEKITVPKQADRATNNLTNLNAPSSTFATSESQSAGITKTGKIPSTKETQEMNSAGIVMY